MSDSVEWDIVKINRSLSEDEFKAVRGLQKEYQEIMNRLGIRNRVLIIVPDFIDFIPHGTVKTKLADLAPEITEKIRKVGRAVILE